MLLGSEDANRNVFRLMTPERASVILSDSTNSKMNIEEPVRGQEEPKGWTVPHV